MEMVTNNNKRNINKCNINFANCKLLLQ